MQWAYIYVREVCLLAGLNRYNWIKLQLYSILEDYAFVKFDPSVCTMSSVICEEVYGPGLGQKLISSIV